MKKETVKVIFKFMLFVVCLFVIACGKNESIKGAEEAQKKDELIFVEREIASNPDPNYYPGSSHYLGNGASETLFKIGADGEVRAFLAQGAEQLDKNTWKITLRPEAKFWSGEPVNSKAVIGSLERTRKTNAKAISFLEGLDFSVIDDYSFEVKTNRENLEVPLSLAYMELSIINPEKAHDSVETMDMTGMYKVVSFEPKKIILEINENYYGKKPNIKRIIHEEIRDNEARTLAALSGRVDIVRGIPNESIQQLSQNNELVLHMTPAANTETIYLNLKKPALSDTRVRQALSWGLDRDELVLLGSEGQSTALSTWLSSNPKYKEERAAVYDKYDPDRASKLLDQAGWMMKEDGKRYKGKELLKIKLMTWGQDKALGETIQNQWSKLGIEVEVQYGDYSLIEVARDTGEWDALIEAWQTYGDEFSLLSGQFSPSGKANYGKYNDDKTNELLEKLAKAGTQEEKFKLALAINERVAEQAPAIFVYPRVETSSTRKSLKGFQEHFRQFENVINENLNFE